MAGAQGTLNRDARVAEIIPKCPIATRKLLLRCCREAERMTTVRQVSGEPSARVILWVGGTLSKTPVIFQ